MGGNSENFNLFVRLCDKHDVDDKIFHIPYVYTTLKGLERWGNDVGKQFEDWTKGKPKAPNPAQTLMPPQSVVKYLEPDNPTTLYNVGAKEDKDRKPFLKKPVDFISDLSYGIKDWDGVATKKLAPDKDLTFVLGEHAGVKYEVQNNEKSVSEISLLHNNRNNRNELEYYTENPLANTCISVFQQRENYGATFSHYNKLNKISFGASTDKYSSSMSVNWHPNNNVELGGYANWNYKDKVNNCIGVWGKIEL